MDTVRAGSNVQMNITRVRGGQMSNISRSDYVATEEPLEIRIVTPERSQKLAITMRTPGADFELAVGFLFSERVICHRDDVVSIRYCVDKDIDEAQKYNVVNVTLATDPNKQLAALERHFIVNSSCGVCGKASIDALEAEGIQPITSELQTYVSLIAELSDKLRNAQNTFDKTGGLHAVGLFDSEGKLLAVREDVGRHNAMDKLLGWAVMQDLLPLNNHIVLVSGRASYELVQKALTAQIPLFCAISAPSSLAVATARRFGMTLIGFLRGDNFNIYCYPQRIC